MNPDLFVFILELVSVTAFAISGALVALKNKMDLFGTITMGVVTAVGGGVMRDILLGRIPPTMFIRPIYALVAVITSAVFVIPAVRKFLAKNYSVYNKLLFFLDTLGLGIFTVVGISIAFEEFPEGSMFLAAFVGVVTGVGGGVMRDVFSGTIPSIFVKHIYALASIAGALVSVMLWDFCGKYCSMLIGMAVIILIRVLSAHFRWNVRVRDTETFPDK